jgi:N-methylhydantoinase B/oxoprolinase/acetone carboxylase alpha subunit
MNLRMPDHFLVDRKSAIAGDMKVREELLITLEEFGLEYFDQAMRECIEIERRAQLARVRERLVPGRYRNVNQFEFTGKDLDIPVPYAKVDELVLEPIEMTVTKEGKLSVDLDGTGKWGWHPCNTNPNAMLGGLALVITQTLSYAGRANTGTEMGLEAKAPYDTLVNPSTTLLASGSAWVNVLGAGGSVVGMLGQGFYSRGFVEEAGTANHGMPGWNLSAEHYLHPGMQLSGIPADYSGLSGWTGPLHDGLNAAGCIHTAELDTGNTEVWEMFMPYNETGKALNPYCQGFGRKRSGVNLSFCYLVHENSKILALHDCGITGHNLTMPNTGKFGGYPGPILHWYVAKNTGVKESAAARKPIPTRYGNDPKDPFELKKLIPNAEVYKCGAHQVSPVALDPWDMVFHSSMDNAGGWGDPLERDPAEIERDLNDGLMPPEMTLGVYGVKCSYDEGKKEWKVASTEEVKAERDKIKQKRLQKGKPFKEWWAAERKKIQTGDLEPWIKASYNESTARSERWGVEFRQFWGLAEDATL